MVPERKRGIRALQNRLVPKVDAIEESYSKALESGITPSCLALASSQLLLVCT